MTLAAADKIIGAAINMPMAELDMSETNSVISFGSFTQAQLKVFSQALLQVLRNKDIG